MAHELLVNDLLISDNADDVILPQEQIAWLEIIRYPIRTHLHREHIALCGNVDQSLVQLLEGIPHETDEILDLYFPAVLLLLEELLVDISH